MTTTLCAATLALWLTGGAAAVTLKDATTLERIEAAYQRGDIDAEDYVMYRLYRVTDRDRLPAELVAPADQERPLRCGTLIVRDARRATPWLSEKARLEVDELLTPEPLRYDTYESDNFSVIVGQDGGVPIATVNEYLDNFETSWDVEVDQTGFDMPPCTDQYYFDVYMGGTGADVPDIEEDVYGYADHHDTDCPFVVVHPDYSFTGDHTGSAQITAAHEFQHGIQSGYNWWAGDFWMEATATWAEDLVFDDVNGYVEYTNDGGWLDYPEQALAFEDGWHEYGNVLWAMFLEENYGGATAVVAVWQQAAYNDDTLDAMDLFLTGQGSSLDTAFAEFALALAVDGLEESDNLDGVWMADHDSYPVNGEPDQYLPEAYGSNYLRFLSPGTPDTLELLFDGETALEGQSFSWALTLVTIEGGQAYYETLAPDPNGIATAAVDGFGGAVSEAILIASVVGDTGYEPGTGGIAYTYSASCGDAVAGDDDDDDGDDDDDDDGAGDDQGTGCNCRVDGQRAPATVAVLALLGLLGLRRRR